MSEEITVEAVTEPVIDEAPAQTDAPVKKSRATKKAAEEAPVAIDNVVVEEAVDQPVTDEGQKVITGPTKTKPARTSNMQSKEDNTLGSRAADRALAKKNVVEEKPKDNKEKVALWSSKNIRWTEVGALSKGYNIVSKEAAEKWLAKEGIRKATPEEVATYYGK